MSEPRLPEIPLTYRPEIDGLRAVAVLAVVIFHAGFGVPGGFVGVDVFFVISGYLITALLVRDLERGRFSMIDFWERRIRRIFPALSAMVLATFALGAPFLLSLDLANLGRSLLAQAGFVSNIYFWMTGGYFGGASKEKALLHTWSLSVEEQFYIVLPLALWALYRFLPGRWRTSRALSLELGVVMLVSLVIAAMAVGAGKYNSSYFLLPMRAWEMLLGSVLAVLPAVAFPRQRAIREGASWLGLGAILAACFLYSPRTAFPGLAALLPCLGTALVIWGNTPKPGAAGTLCARLLSTRIMLGIGLISYSLYLWHWPLFAYAHYLHMKEPWLRASLLGTSFVLAWASWKWVETPVRKKQVFGSRRALFGFFFVMMALYTTLGSSVILMKGFPNRFSGTMAANDRIVWKRCEVLEEDLLRADRFEVVLENAQAQRFRTVGADDLPITVMLWADSHGQMLEDVFDTVLEQSGRAGYSFTPGGLAPLVGGYNSRFWSRNHEVSDAVMRYLETHPEVQDVILMGYWAEYQEYDSSGFRKALTETLRRLEAAGKRVWLVGDIPTTKANIPRTFALNRTAELRASPQGWPTVSRHRRINSIVNEVRAHFPNVHYIDAAKPFLTRGGEAFRLDDDGVSLYVDGDHLSPEGALKMLLPLFHAELLPALRGEAEQKQ